MTALDAAYQVLLDAGVPLHVGEITLRAIDAGLWITQGLTPNRTMSATLSTDVRDHGQQSRFVRTGPGIYSLNTGVAVQPPLVEETGVGQQEATVHNPVETLTFLDAAEYILRNFAGKQLMHYKVLTDKALELQLISTTGLTPAATMYAQILRETSTMRERGERPRFVMHGDGLVGLSEWEPQGLAGLISSHNKEIRQQLLERLRNLPPQEFEQLVALLITALGFEEVEVTAFHGDQGIDIRATLVVGEFIRTRMAVQVKRWNRNIQAPVIQQVRGGLSPHEQGLIITTSDFSPGAYEEASRSDRIPVALMNGKQLTDLLIENNIGVTRTSYDLFELADVET